MFKQRLIATLILAPLVLLIIYFANYWVFGALILLLTIACGIEWLQLIPLKKPLFQVVFLIILVALTLLNFYMQLDWLWLGMVLWLLILFAVLSFPASQPVWGHNWVVAVLCLILLPLFAQSLLILQNGIGGLLIYLLFLVWATDIGAYLAGKQWGAHKLIPAVSPGKTIEGSSGGFLLAMLVAIGGYYYFKPQSATTWFIIAAVTILISMLGDLFISMLKRRSKVKDTGHIIPGHGGILDRLDSLIAAAPLFVYGLRYLSFGI